MSGRRTAILLALVLGENAALAQAPPTGHDPLYPVFADGRWGMIDSSGRLVLPLRFEKVARWPSSWNPANFPEPAHAAISVSAPWPIEDAVIAVRSNGQAGVATRDGQVLALGVYDSIEDYREGRAWVSVGSRLGVVNEQGELLGPLRDLDRAWQFDGGYAFAEAGGRWGVIDREGREVVAPTWDEVQHSQGDTWASVRTGKLWGVVERSGTIVVPPRFEMIGRPLPPLTFAVDSGRAVYIRPDGTVAFEVNCSGKRSGGPKAVGYSFFTATSAVVKCGGNYTLIDLSGRFLLEPKWDGIGVLLGESRYLIWDGGKTGIVDEAGRVIVPLQERFRYCGRGIKKFSIGPKDGLAGLDGRVVVPATFDVLGCPDEYGMAAAHTPSKEGFKAGFVDTTGTWVIKPEYRAVDQFRGPLATVSKPLGRQTTELSYIDRSGKVVYRMEHQGFMYTDEEVRRFR